MTSLSDFTVRETHNIPSTYVSVREFSKLLGVPDQMIHQYTNAGRLNFDKLDIKYVVLDTKCLNWLGSYVSKKNSQDLHDRVLSFLTARFETDTQEEE